MKSAFMARTLAILLAMVLILTACSGGGGSNSEPPAPSAPSAAEEEESAQEPGEQTVVQDFGKDVSGEVTIWVFNENVFEEIADAFMAEYPKIKVNTIFVPFAELHDKLQTALASGTGAPDIAEVEQGQFTRYVTGGVLENLLAEPYDAGQYKDLVPEYNWERWMSPDGKQLLGMPWDSTPGVWYYRADIFEELGLPSDPAELGEYITDGENFLALTQVLTSNGKYLFEWRDGPIHWAGDEIGYFDDNLNWIRDNDRLVQILDYTKRGNQMNWAPHMGIFTDEGKQLVLSGQVAGVALGSWGARELAVSFPELSGKWRVTNLPFGLNFPIGGSSFVIPSQSPNKEAAWVYLQWAMRSENAWKIWTKYSIQPGYSDIAQMEWYAEQANAFLGGQQDYKMYEELAHLIPTKRLNPLDGRGWELWVPRILDALDKNIDSRTTLQLAKEDAENILKEDIEKLRQQLQQP
ncbi:extracellular solute-binding protein [Paenibacillus cisolokensis]|uniref:ABC transporter substrate-binding protein n=1 Tax=Paenibacillus cisolokensis TaxID=1658519 RepID=UPI003D2B6F32